MVRASHACVGKQVGPEATRPVWGGGSRLALGLTRRTVASMIGTHHFGKPWGGVCGRGAVLGILATLYQA